MSTTSLTTTQHEFRGVVFLIVDSNMDISDKLSRSLIKKKDDM